MNCSGLLNYVHRVSIGSDAFPWGYYFVEVDNLPGGNIAEDTAQIIKAQTRLLNMLGCKDSKDTPGAVPDGRDKISSFLCQKRYTKTKPCKE